METKIKSKMNYIVINFKHYVFGQKAISLAQRIHSARSRNYQIILLPPFLSLETIAKIHQPIFAQHVDGITPGAHTGKISAAELKSVGVQGALLNHAERKIPLSELKSTIKICKKEKVQTLICASSMAELQAIAKLTPTFIAYEPERLIGTENSVTKHPHLLQKAKIISHRISPRSKLLCGAGIHSKEDLQRALALGFDGVLLSHAVCSSKNPKIFLQNFMK